MSIISRPTAIVKPVTIEIQGVAYAAERLKDVLPAITLRKADGTTYELFRHGRESVTCTCPAYHYSKWGDCKHARAALDLGLLESGHEPLADAGDWPDWTDRTRVGLGPEPTKDEVRGAAGRDLGPADPFDDLDLADDGQRLTLTQWLEALRDHYRAIGSDAADLVAFELSGLVGEAIALGRPRDAGTFLDRRAAMMGFHDE